MYNPLFYLLGLAAIYAVAHVLAKRVPFFRRELHRTRAGHLGSLDGLRGLLSISVFFSHAVISFHFWQGGGWVLPPSLFFGRLGEIPVLLFFCLSGFLFWTKLTDPRRSTDWRAFYGDRTRRIGPAYFLSVFSIFLVVACKSRFYVNGEITGLAASVFRWLTFGLPDGSFPNLNGFPSTSLINADVFWTLTYEWLFYLTLPLLTPFTKGNRLYGLLGSVLVSYVLLRHAVFDRDIASGHSPAYVALTLAYLTYLGSGFGIGMVAAQCRRKFPGFSLEGNAAASLLGIAAYGLLLAAPLPGSLLLDFVIQRGLLALLFLSVVFGVSFFGLFKSDAFRLMGMVSYSVYVLHGIVLYVLFWLNRGGQLTHLGAFPFWGVMFLTGILVLLVSCLSYRWVEYPFLQRKPKVAKMTSA